MQIEFEKITLPNGMDVILHRDAKLPIVHVNLWFHVGSKNERKGRTGFAHLFEHMMFQGSRNAKGDYFSFVEKAGANLREGGVNGTTSFDRTNYFATVPSGNLDFLLWLESDRVATLSEVLNQKDLDNQRDVVKNERRQSMENAPYGRWIALLSENLYPPDHPYSWPIIGSHEDLTAATIDDVRAFFETWYTANNLSMVVAGDFDPVEARALVEKHFGDLQPGPVVDRPSTFIPRLSGTKIVEATDRVPQERSYLVWHAPQYFSGDEPRLDLASSILTDGLSARLSRALVYDRQLASDVSAFNWANEIAGSFIVVATARPGVPLDEVEGVVVSELERLASEGPTPEELRRAQVKRTYEFVTGLERIGGFGGKADLLNQYNVFLGDPDRFREDIDRYAAVTAEDIASSLRRWVTPERLQIRFRPEKGKRSQAPATARRDVVPALGVDRSFETPGVIEESLPNGATLYVVERHELPKVAVTVALPFGTRADPAGKEGLTTLMMQTLDRGTTSRSALEVEDALGDLGTSIHPNAGREYSLVSLDVLEANLDQAMELLADILLHPVFDEDELSRERMLHIDALRQESNNPGAIAARLRPMLIFGASHSHGRPGRGLPSTVEGITHQDLALSWSTLGKPQGAAIIFAGDITPAAARALVERHLSEWKGAPPARTVSTSPQPAQPAFYVVDRADATQTIVSQILPGPGRFTPDYHALRLADAVWGGGGFGTRLNLNLREEKGYTYGVFSNQVMFRDFGAWWAQGGMQTDKTAEAVTELVSELRGLSGERPITGDELSIAKLTRIRGYAQQFESLGRIAGQIAELWSFGLPMTEIQNEPAEMERVTVDAANEATRKYITPEQAIYLFVGDRAQIEAPLRALGMSEIVLLDAEGKRIE